MPWQGRSGIRIFRENKGIGETSSHGSRTGEAKFRHPGWKKCIFIYSNSGLFAAAGLVETPIFPRFCLNFSKLKRLLHPLFIPKKTILTFSSWSIPGVTPRGGRAAPLSADSLLRWTRKRIISWILHTPRKVGRLTFPILISQDSNRHAKIIGFDLIHGRKSIHPTNEIRGKPVVEE